jgi:hypothetical protein
MSKLCTLSPACTVSRYLVHEFYLSPPSWRIDIIAHGQRRASRSHLDRHDPHSSIYTIYNTPHEHLRDQVQLHHDVFINFPCVDNGSHTSRQSLKPVSDGSGQRSDELRAEKIVGRGSLSTRGMCRHLTFKKMFLCSTFK